MKSARLVFGVLVVASLILSFTLPFVQPAGVKISESETRELEERMSAPVNVQTAYVTYADGVTWQPVQKRNVDYAVNQWGVQQVYTYDRSALDPVFLTLHAEVLNQKRGGGYWLWKPYVILKTLLSTSAKYVIYCDSGSKILEPLSEFTARAQPIAAYHMNNPENEWSKRDAIQAILGTATVDPNRKQLAGGYICLKVGPESVQFVREWLMFGTNFQLIGDAPSLEGPEVKEFREHRHDQSLFSLLCAKYPHWVTTRSAGQPNTQQHVFGSS